MLIRNNQFYIQHLVSSLILSVYQYHPPPILLPLLPLSPRILKRKLKLLFALCSALLA